MPLTSMSTWIQTGLDVRARTSTSGSTVNVPGCNMVSAARTQGTLALSSGEAELYAIGQGVSEALFVRSMLLESKLAKKVNVIAHTASTAGKSMATRFGTGKKTKHVELRFLYVQNLVQMGLLRMAKIEGTRNPADLMTKYVATDVLQRLRAHLGVVSNWFKDLATDAHDTDDHVAPVVNAQWPPRPQPPPYWNGLRTPPAPALLRVPIAPAAHTASLAPLD